MKNYLLRKIDNIGASTSAITGTLIIGQFPQFIAQYLQRIGGHIDEAKYFLEKYNHPHLINRISNLEKGLSEITNASPLNKIIQFIEHIDINIAHKTLENYIPGITIDSQGLIYCGIGALTGLIIYEIIKEGIKLATKKKIPNQK